MLLLLQLVQGCPQRGILYAQLIDQRPTVFPTSICLVRRRKGSV